MDALDYTNMAQIFIAFCRAFILNSTQDYTCLSILFENRLFK